MTKRCSRDRRPLRSGFTLLEVLLVLAILGVIAGIVVPRLLGQQRTANIKAARTSISGLEKALDLWAVDNNATYPEGNIQAVMNALMSGVDARGQAQEMLLTEEPRDPWGNLLNYEYPTSKTRDGRPAIWSNGPNGIDDNGGGDDITNWMQEVI